MTFTVTPLISYTYVYIHVSHVYKLACTLYRTINLLSLSALSSHIRQTVSHVTHCHLLTHLGCVYNSSV
jgi:hypothetical protein